MSANSGDSFARRFAEQLARFTGISSGPASTGRLSPLMDRTVFVLAGTQAECEAWARAARVPRHQARFVDGSGEDALRGFIGMDLYVVGSYYRRGDAERVIQLARMQGFRVMRADGRAW